jgi:type VI secretion system secreted protein VgrG
MSAAAILNQASNLEVTVSTGDVLDVRHFSVRERMSTLFEVQLEVLSRNPDIDFAQVLGGPASFMMNRENLAGSQRGWSGICNHIEQVGNEDEETGLSTYQLTIVPTVWFLTQRRNHRMFQLKSEPDIVLQMLAEWGIEPEVRVDLGAYKDRKYRVQYAESDFDFINRMLEDAGITYHFEWVEGQSKLVLSDAPTDNAPRPSNLPYVNSVDDPLRPEYVTEVQIMRLTRPGRYTQRDIDYRRPASFPLLASATGEHPVEQNLERFHYTPGAFLFRSSGGGSPTADDRGSHRTDLQEAEKQALKRLHAKQGSARSVVFVSGAFDLRPGVVFSIEGHRKSELASSNKLLVIAGVYEGGSHEAWTLRYEARFADLPFRPALRTPKPKVMGIESATVVGPAGEEIHTDEFGRVRVHFHWDRESSMNEESSCWIPVSQPWAGTGYGGVNIPRIGQEVIVDFLGGDPDRPVVVGRVFTDMQKAPYGLPGNKTKSGFRSNSSPSNGGFSELMFEDAAGSELVRFQAERDYSGLVKNDSGHVIGNNSTSHVGANETHSVVTDQTIKVGRDRKIRVQRDQAHVVDRSIIQQAVQGTTTSLSKEAIYHKSEQAIILSVGTSAIILEPSQITIQGDLVNINPGGVQLPAPPQPPAIDGVVQQDGHFFGAP